MTIASGARVLMDAQQEMIISTKVKKPDTETDKGVPLAPSEKDLKPWYSEKGKGRTLDEMDNDMRCVFGPGIPGTPHSHNPHTEFETRIVNQERTRSHRLIHNWRIRLLKPPPHRRGGIGDVPRAGHECRTPIGLLRSLMLG